MGLSDCKFYDTAADDDVLMMMMVMMMMIVYDRQVSSQF